MRVGRHPSAAERKRGLLVERRLGLIEPGECIRILPESRPRRGEGVPCLLILGQYLVGMDQAEPAFKVVRFILKPCRKSFHHAADQRLVFRRNFDATLGSGDPRTDGRHPLRIFGRACDKRLPSRESCLAVASLKLRHAEQELRARLACIKRDRLFEIISRACAHRAVIGKHPRLGPRGKPRCGYAIDKHGPRPGACGIVIAAKHQIGGCNALPAFNILRVFFQSPLDTCNQPFNGQFLCRHIESRGDGLPRQAG